MNGVAAAPHPAQDEPGPASSSAVVQEEDRGFDRDFTSPTGGRHRPGRSDFLDLRAWSAGKSTEAGDARVGPVGNGEARAACTSEEESASEKTMVPAVAGGRHGCGGSGKGVRAAGIGPGSAAEGGGGGEGGGLRLPPAPSVAVAPATAAGAAEMERVFVRKSPWSRPLVARAPAAGARDSGAGPTPSTAESTATAATAVTLPRPHVAAAAAGGHGLLSDSSGDAAEEGDHAAGDRHHSSPRGAVASGCGGEGRTRQHEADRHGGESRHPAHAPLSVGGTGTSGATGPSEYGRCSDSDHGMTGEDSVGVFSVSGNSAGAGQSSGPPSSPPDRQRRRPGPGSPSWSGGSVDSEVSSPSPPEEEEELPPLPTTVLTCEDKETKAVVGILQVIRLTDRFLNICSG